MRTGASLLILAAMPMASPATATTGLPAPAPAPRPAPSGVMGPPDGLITPGPARPTPSPSTPIFLPPPATNQAAPRPAPSDTARPAPRPSPSPTQRPLPPQQRAPTGAPPPTGGERPAAPPPGGGYDINAASGLPAAGPVVPLPESNAASPAETDTIPAPAAAAPAAELPSLASQIERHWPWLAGGGALFLLLLVGWWWRRRQRPLRLPAPDAAGVSQAEPLPTNTPPPPPSTPPTAPKPATAKALGRRADLTLTLEPLAAQSTLLNLRLRYAVTVHNSGNIPAAPVTLRMGMFAGSQAHPQGIVQWLGQTGSAAHDQTPVIAPGESYRFEGELAAPLEALNPMVIEGRTLAIPILAVDIRYGHEAGEAPIEGQAARAFVVGRDSGKEGAKLAPFRLDQGPTSFAPLGQRDTGIGIVA